MARASEVSANLMLPNGSGAHQRGALLRRPFWHMQAPKRQAASAPGHRTAARTVQRRV